MKYENLAFLCEASKIEEGLALNNVIMNTALDDVSTLSDTEVTEAVDTLTYLMESGRLDEASAQFILGAVTESTASLFDCDVFALEGKNIDLMYHMGPLKRELKDCMKSLKKSMKAGDYSDAKNCCDSAEKILDKMEKVLKDSQNDGMVSSRIGTIIATGPIILRVLAASVLAIPLSFIGLGGVPIICECIYELKQSIEVTFASISDILKNQKVSWNDTNGYKVDVSKIIKTTKSQLENFKKTLNKLSSGESEDNDIDPTTTQKLMDAKASLSESLNGMTRATKKKK